MRLSTSAEVEAGTSNDTAVTPADLADRAMKYSGSIIHSGAAPTSFTDVDLSGIIGAKRAFVFLRVFCDTNDTAIYLRPNGETVPIGATIIEECGTTALSLDENTIGYVCVITDAAGVIEWRSSRSGSAMSLTLLCYQILN